MSKLRIAAATAWVLLVLVACGEAGTPQAETPQPPEVEAEAAGTESGNGGWRELPPSPLSARRSAYAFGLAGKVLIVGGTEAPACPPAADCASSDIPSQRDGAWFDPATNEWTRIADAPIPLGFASGAVAGENIYMLVWDDSYPLDGARRHVISYNPKADEWNELPLPSKDDSLVLTSAGGRVVAYQSSQEFGVRSDFVFDPASGEWSELPPDPLRESFDRTMTWTDHGLVLTGIENVPQPGSAEPSIYRAAILEGDKWRRLADSEVIGWNPMWTWSAGRLVNTSIQSADGGEVNGWGRAYPSGGMLDVAAERWEPLPNTPKAMGELTAVYADGPSAIVAGEGWVFEPASGKWTELTRPPGAPESESAAAWAGDGLVVWGGVRFEANGGKLLSDGWLWQS